MNNITRPKPCIMKTSVIKKRRSPFVLEAIIFSLLIVFAFNTMQAQTFYLQDYVTGNSYDPYNRSFTWDAGNNCPYNWSIKTKRIDYLGGELELHASPGTKPECESVYKITWTFSKDMRVISCGEKIAVDVTNIPVSKQDCGIFVWEGDNNPSSITIICGLGSGESGLVSNMRNNDPTASYRDYVFSHQPSHVVHGEQPTYLTETIHKYNARLELVVCSRPDFAEVANGGSFAFRIGNRGISFDVVYLYSKNAAAVTPQITSQETPQAIPSVPPPLTSLQNPVIQHNIKNTEGIYWMAINVPGSLQGYKGRQIQLVIRFVDSNRNFLRGSTSDLQYIDASGNAATGSNLITVDSDIFDLGTQQIWMPYYALNLTFTGGQQTYDIYAYAELFVDGQVAAQSQLVPLRVNW